MNNNHILNLQPLPLELKLLLGIVGENEFRDSLTDLTKQVNWALFLDFVRHHRLFPGLKAKMQLMRDLIIPDKVYQKLEQWDHVNTLQMLRLTGEMEIINQHLNGDRIRTLFLKGPILAKVLYGDIALRTSSDIDLLVPLENLKSVENTLVKMGYVKDDYIETVLGDWKWRHHHFAYFHPEKKVKVEVHWRLNPGPGKEPSFEELWSRKNSICLAQEELHLLGNEDLFFYLVTHGARHGWSRFRWLLDIHQLMSSDLDWLFIRHQFKTYNSVPVAGQALILTNQFFYSQINEAAKFFKLDNKSFKLANEALFYMKDMINLHNEPLPHEVSSYHKNHLIHLMSIQQRSLFYLSTLFPYPEDAMVLPLPKKIHFLYFILRPFIWVWRKQRKNLTQEVKG